MAGGETLSFSSTCNPDFEDKDGTGCYEYARKNYCNAYKTHRIWFVNFASQNEDGIWETGLQCPECGCGANGATDLNSLSAEYDDFWASNK